MSKYFCTECGQTLSLNTNFCSGCGKKTHQEKPQSAAQNICRHCGMQHSPTAVFCMGCGQKIINPESPSSEQNSCVNCGQQNSPTVVFCVGCGKNISKGDLKKQVFDKTETKTTGETTSIDEITPDEDDNKTANKNKTFTEERISPTTESITIISKVEPSNTVSNNNTNAIYNNAQPMIDVKHTRCFFKRPVIITLVVLVVFLGAFTAYLNGWLKNPFNKPIPYDPETSVYAADMGDWQNYPDLKKEQDAIAKRQDKLISDLEKGNIEKAVKYFYPDYQSGWQKQMEDNPESTTALAAVLSTAEMTFLGKDDMPKENPRSCTATFLVKYEQSGFYITWIKSDGTWYLYDF